MKTKALLLSAAIAAAVAPTAMAQVYSVNAVGYINLPTVTAGSFAILANQLDNRSGNKLADVFPAAPTGTRVYGWDVVNQGYIVATFDDYEAAWLPAADADMIDLSPGKAVFVQAPAGSDLNITLVGDVMQGELVTQYPTDGKFALIASKVPQAGQIETDLKFTPASGDRVYQLNAEGTYDIATYDDYEGSWLPNDVTLAVGEGFWLKASSTSSGSWTRNFDINDPST